MREVILKPTVIDDVEWEVERFKNTPVGYYRINHYDWKTQRPPGCTCYMYPPPSLPTRCRECGVKTPKQILFLIQMNAAREKLGG